MTQYEVFDRTSKNTIKSEEKRLAKEQNNFIDNQWREYCNVTIMLLAYQN